MCYTNPFKILRLYLLTHKLSIINMHNYIINVTAKDKDNDVHLFMASQALCSHELNTWLIDSGCTSHMTKHLSIFTSIDRSIQLKVVLGNGAVVRAKGNGTVTVSTKRGTKLITNVLYIPELYQNLLSVAQMLRNGYAVSFKEIFFFSLMHMEEREQKLK